MLYNFLSLLEHWRTQECDFGGGALWCPRDLFISFKVCSDAKKRVGSKKHWEATAPIHP